jgi:hypothetical protein
MVTQTTEFAVYMWYNKFTFQTAFEIRVLRICKEEYYRPDKGYRDLQSYFKLTISHLKPLSRKSSGGGIKNFGAWKK